MATKYPAPEPHEIQEERDLIETARTGDQRAMSKLLQRHYERMYRTAYKVTRNAALAEDVTQDACVQIIRWLDSYRSEAPFAAWVSRIVVNSALLRLRRERRMVPSATVRSTSEESAEAGPEQLVGDRELLSLADTVLLRLPNEDRELFSMRFIDGMSLNRIARKTGLSVSALKSRFFRARGRLRAESENAAWAVPFAA